jgi:hypothetical protein
MRDLSPYVLVQILSKSWSAPFDLLQYQKQNIVKLVEELKVITQVVAICDHIDHWLSPIQTLPLVMIIFCWM